MTIAEDAVDFAAYLVKTCVIEDAGVSNTEFYNVIDALGKVISNPTLWIWVFIVLSLVALRFLPGQLLCMMIAEGS